MRLSVGFAMNGSMAAVLGSGTASMSEALIGCQPRIDEPSNPEPSSNSASSSSLVGIVKCCQVPSRSQNLRSTASTLLSLANLRTSLGVLAITLRSFWSCGSDGVPAALARAYPHDLVDRQDEDLPVTDAARSGRFFDRLSDFRDLFVADDDFELYLGKEVDDVLGAPVELRMPLLPSEPLHFADRDALHADRRQALFHLVELERLDDRLDLLHGYTPGNGPADAGPWFIRMSARL